MFGPGAEKVKLEKQMWKMDSVMESGHRRLRLESFYGRYLAPHPTDANVIYGRKVFLDDLGIDVNWEPLRGGDGIRLKCNFDQFLRADSDSSRWREPVTVDSRSIQGVRSRFLWHVECLEEAPPPPPPAPLPPPPPPPTQLPPPPPPPSCCCLRLLHLVLTRKETAHV
ncbi:hypothetical protein MUK42_21518 [Musa troglodytarum]|uniref:DUF569 domain-containing protein n=1 Tax=Musa troglodytarum TaxID=320322 RepID=A0A9E7FWW9_9LILI|nr:hypothetical protein MUK42_21518 [Musa troglodytarum]